MSTSLDGYFFPMNYVSVYKKYEGNFTSISADEILVNLNFKFVEILSETSSEKF